MYGHQDDNCLLEDLPLTAIINAQFDIRAKSELRTNVRKNAPIPPGLPHDPTVRRIDGIKIIESVGGIIRNKNIHKELKSFLYDREILHSNVFDLTDW